MSEEETVRAPDVVDGEMTGDALIHTGAESLPEVPVEPVPEIPETPVVEEKTDE